jgi:hypothetical protein
MAQVHDFVVLDKETYAYEDHMQLVNQVPYDVSIHDNQIMFFMVSYNRYQLIIHLKRLDILV